MRTCGTVWTCDSMWTCLSITLVVLLNKSSALKPVEDIFAVMHDLDLAEVQQSHKLKAGKSAGPAVLHSPFSLYCTVGEKTELELCSWRRGDGPLMFVQDSNIVDVQSNKIEGISVNQTNSR